MDEPEDNRSNIPPSSHKDNTSFDVKSFIEQLINGLPKILSKLKSEDYRFISIMATFMVLVIVVVGQARILDNSTFYYFLIFLSTILFVLTIVGIISKDRSKRKSGEIAHNSVNAVCRLSSGVDPRYENIKEIYKQETKKRGGKKNLRNINIIVRKILTSPDKRFPIDSLSPEELHLAKKNVFLEIEKDEKSGREFVKVKKYTPEEVYVMSYVLVKELDNDEKGPESLCPSGPGGGKNWWDEPWKDIALYSTQLASTENIDKTISRLIFEKQGNKRSKALILASQIARLNLTKVKLQILADLLKAIEYYLSNTNND